LDRLISACKEYQEITGRNIFIEYALFDSVNESVKNAEELIRLLDGLKCSINLILGNLIPLATISHPLVRPRWHFRRN